jgi:tetratricopeptide (TPR) repeat protein/predicted Ser/Thr protein kinase
VIGRLVSRYDMLERLGEGAMGVVFLGYDTRLKRRVAIKFLSATDPRYRARFQREARLLSALSHPNIAVVHDTGETEEGTPFIVMELVTGETLSRLLEKEGLTIAHSVDITIAIAEALAEAHRNGIIHRDIKPSNVIVNDQGQVKVLDFGLAKQLEPAFAGPENSEHYPTFKTQSDVAVGTPAYFSPEQARSQAVDERSDLFSLGVLLYECITGRTAFVGATAVAIGAEVIHSDPPYPTKINSRIPYALARLTMKALAKNRSDRFQNANEMIKELRVIRARLSTEDATVRRLAHGSMKGTNQFAVGSTLTSIIEPLRRRRISLATVVLAVLAVALVAGGLFFFLRNRPHIPDQKALASYNEGVLALRGGAFYRASKLFERALQLDSEFALAHARLAEAYLELDFTDRARDESLRVSTLVPDRTIYPAEDALYLKAISEVITRDFTGAIEDYRRLVALKPDRAEAYADLARAYERAEDNKKAIEAYVEVTRRAPDYATAYLRLGSLYGQSGDISAAEGAFSTAETLHRARQNIEGLAELLYQRGQFYNQLNKISEAREQLQQSLDAANVTANDYQRIKSLLQLASAATTEGKIDEAHAKVNQAIELAQANGMETLGVNGMIDLGNIYLVKNSDEAKKSFDQALELSRKYKLRHGEARALLSLASLSYQYYGDPDQTLSYAHQALPFYQQGNYKKETSQAMVLIGRANALKGNFAEALNTFQELLQNAERFGDQSLIAQAHGELGVCFVQQEQYGKALEHFKTSAEINKSLTNVLSEGFARVNHGNAEWQIGNYEQARADFKRAAEIAAAPGALFQGLRAWLTVTSARMALSEIDLAIAATKAHEAEAMISSPDSQRAADAGAVKCLAQSQLGDVEGSKKTCLTAFGVAQHLRNEDALCSTELALAEALLTAKDDKAALADALAVRDRTNRFGKLDSQWRALLLAAMAATHSGDRVKGIEYATSAQALLSQLEQSWGSDSFHSYQRRPDIQRNTLQLKQLLTPDSEKPTLSPKETHNVKR